MYLVPWGWQRISRLRKNLISFVSLVLFLLDDICMEVLLVHGPVDQGAVLVLAHPVHPLAHAPTIVVPRW